MITKAHVLALVGSLYMADSRKQPELFRSNLFSSPSPGLSLGLGGDETFSSPLSLAPALSTAADAGWITV